MLTNGHNMKIDRLSEADPSSLARGRRAKAIRKTLLRYSRRVFGKKYQLSQGSIQNWEDARYGGMSENGAIKLVKAYQAEGVNCTLEWLFYGIGAGPIDIDDPEKNVDDQAVISGEQAAITEELQLFHQHTPNAIDHIIVDDDMHPHFISGDCVAGKRLFDSDIELAAGKVCIVQTSSGKIMLRLFEADPQSNSEYLLFTTNPSNKKSKTKIKSKDIFSVAPIIWWRRKSS